MPALKNPKYEAFAHAMVSQRYPSALATYMAVVVGREGEEPHNSYRVRVAELMRTGSPVSLRITEIRNEIQDRLDKEKEDLQATFMSVVEKRQWLARVKRCNYHAIAAGTFDFTKDGDLIQGIKQTKFGTEYVMPDKLKAIQLDNEFPGGGGAPDSASKLLERLIRPGIPADRVPLKLDGPVVDVESSTADFEEEPQE